MHVFKPQPGGQCGWRLGREYGAGRYHRTLLAIVWTVAVTLERAMEGSEQRRNIM